MKLIKYLNHLGKAFPACLRDLSEGDDEFVLTEAEAGLVRLFIIAAIDVAKKKGETLSGDECFEYQNVIVNMLRDKKYILGDL